MAGGKGLARKEGGSLGGTPIQSQLVMGLVEGLGTPGSKAAKPISVRASTLHPAPCTLHPAPCTLHPGE